MNERRWLLLSVAVVVLGVAALIARAELHHHDGQTFRVAIEGYDPRDLLHGHYLRYRYAWDWQGPRGCGGSSGGDVPRFDASCCTCLTRRSSSSSSEPPTARQVECDSVERAGCDGWLRGSEAKPPRQYFIPESEAQRLEQAFRDRRAAVDLRVRASGEAEVGELYLDGRPWREVVP